MTRAGIPAFVLAGLLLPGCRSASPFGEDPVEWAPVEATGSPDPVEEGAHYIAGAWGFDGRMHGDLAGSPRDLGAGATAIPGFSLEARVLFRLEDPDSWTTFGLLLEHFRGAEGRADPGGASRAEGALSGALLTYGFASGPRRDGEEIPVDFASRFDVLFGLRRGFAQVEVPDGAGGTFRRGSTWGEAVLGARAEWSPIRRVFLFVRGDVGTEINPRSLYDDEETRGDAAVGARSLQFAAGLRVRPAEHVSLLLGWRYLRLQGRELHDGGTVAVDTARVAWSGPWAGVEVDF